MPTLSEADSKRRLAPHGVPFPDERQVTTVDDAVTAAEAIGLPVVLKLGGDAIAHKTERGLVRLGLGDTAAVAEAASSLLAAARAEISHARRRRRSGPAIGVEVPGRIVGRQAPVQRGEIPADHLRVGVRIAPGLHLCIRRAVHVARLPSARAQSRGWPRRLRS